ncbi:MAG TPA: ABC transporter substrate-binding protein [Candidatus Manganitrophaceae bacterium]|nr:ABC transporter substrate-binding protein [Candidatus Manganitrophaceae bacterium]
MSKHVLRYSLFVHRFLRVTFNDSRLTKSVPLLLLVFFFSGCASRPPSDHPFVIAIDATPTQLDPRLATDAYSERIDHLLFSGLIRLDPDGRIVPELSHRWGVEGGTIYTFHLNRSVRFHDGRPLTSEDVRYTYESILDPALASPHRKTYDVIDHIETPDPAVVRFVLTKPHAPFLATLARGVVPKHLAGSPRFSSHPVGSGPFSFVRSEPDEGVELAADPRHFQGAPKISRLLIRVIPEESVRLLEVEKGNIDLIQNAFPPDALPRLRRNPRLKVIQAPGSTYTYLGFNLKDPILRNKKVRQAIATAVDREEITEHLFKGLARPASGLLPPDHWAAAPVASYLYDPERAKELLDEAGYPDPPGSPPRFKLIHKTSQNEPARRVAEAIQYRLDRVGIDVEIRSYEWGTFYADIKSGNFQMFTLSWVGVNDPDIYYNIFHSESVPPNGSNRGFYRNARLDRLVEEGRGVLDVETRRALYGEAQKIIADEVPYVSLWHTMNVAVMKREVEGYALYRNGDFYSLKEARKR